LGDDTLDPQNKIDTCIARILETIREIAKDNNVRLGFVPPHRRLVERLLIDIGILDNITGYKGTN
jgi:hypothetical protein